MEDTCFRDSWDSIPILTPALLFFDQMKIQIPKPRSNVRSKFCTDRAGTEFQKNFEEKHPTKIVKAVLKTDVDRYLQNVP